MMARCQLGVYVRQTSVGFETDMEALGHQCVAKQYWSKRLAR